MKSLRGQVEQGGKVNHGRSGCRLREVLPPSNRD
jgi:hypothetical protein